MNIYTPYTYLIGWSRLNWWYYGVRFAKGCNPADLWVRYFTSSKEVAIVRDLYGEPDIIQIRKTFTNIDKDRRWETQILKRMKVVSDPKWLNKTDNKSREPKYGIENPMYGLEPYNKGLRTKRISVMCKSCDVIFETFVSSKSKFCSDDCYTVFRKNNIKTKTLICPECSINFTILNSMKQTFCSKPCMYDSRRLPVFQ